jgi:multisubunit Na+/H+ antiporter MnhB subunit
LLAYRALEYQQKKSRRSLSLLLVTYLLIFGPKFYAIDMTVSVAIGLAIFYIIKIVVDGKIQKIVMYSWIYICTITLYFSIISLATYNDPYLLAKEFGKLNLYIASASGIVELYKIRYANKYSIPLLQDIFISILFTALIVILFFVLPDFRYYSYSMVDVYLFHGRAPEAIKNRITDLSIGGSTVSLVFVFGAMLSLDSKIWQWNKAFKYLSLFYFMTILLATLLTGRTGFIILSAIVIVWLIYISIKQPLTLITGFGVFAICVAIIITWLHYFTNNELIDRFLDTIAPWAFEFIYSYIESGQFDSASGRYLADQYILPDNAIGFLFGGERYDIPSDSLFIKLMHSVGVVGVLMTIIMFVVLLHWKRSKIVQKYVYLFFGLLIVGNLKETMLGNSRGAIILFLLLVVASTQLTKYDDTNSFKSQDI